jgi:hypothetical protein
MAPDALLFTVSPVPPAAALRARGFAAAGFEAGATVVFAGDEEEVVRQVERRRLYHFVQSVVVAVVFVFLVIAPGVLPAGACLAAVRHWTLFTLPALVQS